MKTKKKQISKGKKMFSNKRLLILVMSLVIMIVSSFLLFQFLIQTPETEFSFKAAIIDQIGETFPSNPESAHEFNETVTNLLENAGFNVSYHESKSITVDFFRGLAKYNYGMIIIRGHSAQRGENEKITVDFFTSERFDANKYGSMQRDGLLSRGNYTWESGKFYFAITPKFIEHLEGSFPKSVVIAMGCWSLEPNSEEMADAFIQKGAEAYIGWTNMTGMSHSDSSTIRFLEYFLVDNMTIRKAIDECNKVLDPEWSPVRFSYYPSRIGDYKLSDFTIDAVLNTFLFAAQTRLLSRSKKLHNFKNAA